VVTLRATLFDMDGLLVDSEILWHKAELEIFGDLGVPISDTGDRSTKGMFVGEVVEYWFERFPWSGPSREEVVTMLLARVGNLVESEGRTLPGAQYAIDLCAKYGPLALASSTPLELIYRCLDHFGLRGYFQSVQSAEFEPFGKPHPGVFLSAAASLDVAARDCLVIEDSAAGVSAGVAARMTVVAVPTPEDAGQSAFAKADLILHSLCELTPAWMDERFGR
jgi:sugar-phosphatase